MFHDFPKSFQFQTGTSVLSPCNTVAPNRVLATLNSKARLLNLMQHCCSEMRAGTLGQRPENNSCFVCRGIEDRSSNLYRIRTRVSIVPVIIKTVKGIPRVFCLTGQDSLISARAGSSSAEAVLRPSRLACLRTHWRQLYCQPQLDEPTCPPALLIVCETEPEEVDDHERQHRQPRDGQIQLTILQSRVQLRSHVRSKSAARPHDCGVNDSVRGSKRR